jgi:hypothetical protein
MPLASRPTNVSPARIVPFGDLPLPVPHPIGVDDASVFLAVHPLIPDMPKRTDISSILIIGADPSSSARHASSTIPAPRR